MTLPSFKSIPEDQYKRFREICEKNDLPYTTLTNRLIFHALQHPELMNMVVAEAKQWVEDQRPATVEEARGLREENRRLQEELKQLRAFKEQAVGNLQGDYNESVRDAINKHHASMV